MAPLKKLSQFIASRLVTGMLIAAPICLAVLLLLKTAKSLSAVVLPLAKSELQWKRTSAHGAAGDVDRGSPFAQRDRNSTSAAAAGSGADSDFPARDPDTI